MSYLYPRMCVIMFFRLTIIWLYTYCLCCQHKLPTTVFIHTYSTKYSFIIVYNILANKKEEVYRQEECYHLPSYTQKPERSIASRCRCFTDGSCHRRWGKGGCLPQMQDNSYGFYCKPEFPLHWKSKQLLACKLQLVCWTK